MERKNQNKYYNARVGISIFVFMNIYQMFSPITLLKPIHMLRKIIV